MYVIDASLAEVSKGLSAERFGKYFMYHLMSMHFMTDLCADITGHRRERPDIMEMNTCLMKGIDTIINRLTIIDDLDASTIIYYMLSDLAAGEADRKCLIEDCPDSKLASLLPSKHLSPLSMKLPQNKSFNKLYEIYLVDPCQVIVDRPEPGKSISVSRVYSRLAYSSCKTLVLDPSKLQRIPDAVAQEKLMIQSGKAPFRYRFPELHRKRML